MTERTNIHVRRLGRFLPFTPAHDQIYEEYQQTEDSLSLPTAAFDYLQRAVVDRARIVVLTGDAGHGKTHLCRRLIEQYLGYSEDEARELINSACDGRQIIRHREGGHRHEALRVFKDFSELTPEVAARLVEASAASDEAVTIICANEGRLRAVLRSEHAGDACRELLERFDATFRDGLASSDGLTHIVNLNHQSVASTGHGETLVAAALREWTSGTRWRVCNECSSQPYCPIFRNREMLSERTSDTAGARISGLELLLSTLERIGVVITVRDILMAVAYMITGGLACEDVHKEARRRRKGWQYPYAFYNLAFEPPRTISREKLRRVPLMQNLARLDPGHRANREVDERIVNEQGVFEPGDLDLLFPLKEGSRDTLVDAANGIDEVIGNPRNRKERAREADEVNKVVRCLRRRAYFDGVGDDGADMRRLGFPNGREFIRIVDKSMGSTEIAPLKRRIIAGLHHIQGLQIPEREPTLELVDPAFGRSTAKAAILSDRVPSSRIRLLRLAEKWQIAENKADWAASKSVDWLDRHVVLRIVDASGHSNDLLLDLMMFDCLFRASRGHVPSKFYEHDIRRISSFLGRLAQAGRGTGEQITALIDGRRKTVSIDDDVIQVGDG